MDELDMREVTGVKIRDVDQTNEWMDRAACVGKCAGDFFPEDIAKGRGRINQAAIARALASCKACPVKKDCRDWADAFFTMEGIWGGETSQERLVRWKTSGISRRQDKEDSQ